MSTFESCSDEFLPNVREILLMSPKEVDALPVTVNLDFLHDKLYNMMHSRSRDLGIQFVCQYGVSEW
jgi:hypothetical protein